MIQLSNENKLEQIKKKSSKHKFIGKCRPTFSACVTVRGKPSKRNPFLHSGLSKLLSIISTTKSSDTNLPASMIRFSSAPIFEPAAISARNISPVDKWHTQYFFFNIGACHRHKNKTNQNKNHRLRNPLLQFIKFYLPASLFHFPVVQVAQHWYRCLYQLAVLWVVLRLVAFWILSVESSFSFIWLKRNSILNCQKVFCWMMRVTYNIYN